MLEKVEGKRRRGRQGMKWLHSITNSMDMNWANSRSWWRMEEPGVLQSIGSQRVGHDLVSEISKSDLMMFSPNFLHS